MADFTMETFRAEMERRGIKNKEPYTAQKESRERHRDTQRALRKTPETMEQFVSSIVRACRARLAKLEKRSPGDVVACPWGVAFSEKCLESCRCEGRRWVRVGFMVDHYRRVLAEFHEPGARAAPPTLTVER